MSNVPLPRLSLYLAISPSRYLAFESVTSHWNFRANRWTGGGDAPKEGGSKGVDYLLAGSIRGVSVGEQISSFE